MTANSCTIKAVVPLNSQNNNDQLRKLILEPFTLKPYDNTRSRPRFRKLSTGSVSAGAGIGAASCHRNVFVLKIPCA